MLKLAEVNRHNEMVIGDRGVMIFEEESNCLSHDFYLTPQYISTEQKHGKNHTFLFLRIREEGSNKVRRIKFGELQNKAVR